ncbi:hypothetical protein PENTCL1PPCAC_10751, partial [Pristionchus entomophagus]
LNPFFILLFFSHSEWSSEGRDPLHVSNYTLKTMQSLLDTLLLLSVTVCTMAAMFAGCGKKKPKVMTDMPNSADASKTGTAAGTSAPPAPPPTTVSQQGDSKTPSQMGGTGTGTGTPEAGSTGTTSAVKPVAPPTNPVDASDPRVPKV